ncbi:MAG TPA: DUF5985 family protein [Polyangiales bacterium]|nr:DUF5985 family protein [Polyangiales bacterium]
MLADDRWASLLTLCWGAIAALALVCSLFFLRFWHDTRDRLFGAFAAAFLVFALNYLGLALLQPGAESRHLIYLLRLAAFSLILLGVIDKNVRSRPR